VKKVVNLSIFRVSLTILVALSSLWMSANLSLILAFSLILTVGLLHGSNDLLIIKKVAKLEYANRWVFIKTLTAYIFSIGVILFAFYANRAYALLFFVIISAYHFGQQHLAANWDRLSFLRLMAYIFYGLGIFGMIFATHADTSAQVISSITTYEVTAFQFKALALISVAGFFIVSFFNPWLTLKAYFIEGALLIVLLGVFLITDLLLSFALYFTFWHSLPSLKDQIHLLYREPFIIGLKRYVRASFFYWAISALAFVGLFMVLDVQNLQVIELLVYFLAAITFPHVMIMSRMESLLES
jgi:Brp/Blh family beta-carotene 15,15'-monooxygenase